MPNFYPIARPLLWRLPPERAHKLAVWALRLRLGALVTTRAARRGNLPILAQRLWGLDFSNPVGLAAGFDKDALAPEAILRLGFGCVEVGTVTPRQQRGNPQPRLFRLDEADAIINRMGFPSAGLDAVVKRLESRRKRPGIVGVNLGKNRDTVDAAADYEEGIRRMAHLADYLVINISSPNTPGLRELQRRAPLEALLQRLLAARGKTGARPPLLVKIAPDLSDEERADIAAVALAAPIDGMIIANTTIARPLGPNSAGSDHTGGLSGRPLFKLSTEILRDIYRLTAGRVPLIGVGGISDADDAYAKIRAGASLVQLHSGLIFAGMNVVAEIKSGLARRLRADGFASIADAVGADHKDPPTAATMAPVNGGAPHSLAPRVGPSPRLREKNRGERGRNPRRKPA